MPSATTDLASILSTAIGDGNVAQLSGGTYTVTQPIVIHIDSTIQGPLGLDGGGATIVSQVTGGQPVIQIVVGPGVDLRYLDFSNFTIQGDGAEGAGISIVAAGNDRWVYNWNVNNVTVQGVGGYGLDVQGSVFEGLVSNSWMNGNGEGGAHFAHLADGQVSALRWFGGGASDNGGAGITLDNGARDLGVDGATFDGNHGSGINAMWGITSVSSSTFSDNTGAGIDFQNYGNFNQNTFESTGAQTVGIDGYLAGNATLIGNTATGTGTLANVQGQGSALQVDNSGTIVDGHAVAVGGVGAGNVAHVTTSDIGVAAPTIAAVTALATAAVASTHGTSPLEAAIGQGLAGQTVHLDNTIYTVSHSIVINLTSSSSNGVIDLGGAKINSTIADGGPVIEVVLGAGVTLSNLTLENFSINGSGGEGDGIKIVADGGDRLVTNLTINNVNVEHTGGVGLDALGNVRHVDVAASWMNGNALGGARFADGPTGGTASDIDWIGGGFRKNGGAGLILDNGTHDMTVKGAYFVDNLGPGIYASSGITLVQASGFENNAGEGAWVNGPANFTDDTFSTWGTQTVAVAATVAAGEQLSMTGSGIEYYGAGADPTVLVNVQGSGDLAIAGGGQVVAGSGVTVAGGSPVLSTSVGMSGSDSGAGTPVTIGLAHDSGVSASDAVTNDATLTGTADPGATLQFSADGHAVAGSTTIDANGHWTFTPTGLGDGAHTIVASELIGTTLMGSAATSFMLQTEAARPFFATASVANDTVTLTGFTGEANDTISVYDGNDWMGFATTGADGTFTISGAISPGVHSYGANATDAAGNESHGANQFLVSTLSPHVAAALTEDTGRSATDGVTSKATLSGTTDAFATVHFTVDGSQVAETTVADASGNWTFMPTDLTDGHHTIVASESNVFGVTASSTVDFMLDTMGPVVTETAAEGGLLNGTGDPNATVHFTVDGTVSTAAAMADATGHWSMSFADLTAGSHAILATEIDDAGNLGSASLSLDVPLHAPTFSALSVDDNGTITLTGDTGEAGDSISLYDGYAWLGYATTDAKGAWSFVQQAAAGTEHNFGYNATRVSGEMEHSDGKVLVGGTSTVDLTGTDGRDLIDSHGANATVTGGGGADMMIAGSGQNTFVYQAASDSTAGASDTIEGFRHGVDKIDFSTIPGIQSANGQVQYQGQLSGLGEHTLAAGSVATFESGGNTLVVVNASDHVQTVSAADTHGADMTITLVGVHLGLTTEDFQHR
jgi:hypothetical protein